MTSPLPEGLRAFRTRIYRMGSGWQWVLMCQVSDAVLDMGHETGKWRATLAARRAASEWRKGKT